MDCGRAQNCVVTAIHSLIRFEVSQVIACKVLAEFLSNTVEKYNPVFVISAYYFRSREP